MLLLIDNLRNKKLEHKLITYLQTLLTHLKKFGRVKSDINTKQEFERFLDVTTVHFIKFQCEEDYQDISARGTTFKDSTLDILLMNIDNYFMLEKLIITMLMNPQYLYSDDEIMKSTQLMIYLKDLKISMIDDDIFKQLWAEEKEFDISKLPTPQELAATNLPLYSKLIANGYIVSDYKEIVRWNSILSFSALEPAKNHNF